MDLIKKHLEFLDEKKNLRLIDSSNLKNKNLQNFKNDFNMLLLQSSDDIKFSTKNFKIVSKIKPTRKVLNNLIFAFNICRS